MPSDPRPSAALGALARPPRAVDTALLDAVRRLTQRPDEDAAREPEATPEATVTGPQYWERARVPRPPSTRSRTGITVSPYRTAPDEQIGGPEMLKSLRLAAPGIVRTAGEILDIEGPMPLQRLVTLVARRFGIPRLDPQRRFHLTRVIGPQFRVIEDFAWPTGTKPTTWRTARRVGDPNLRRVTDISHEELLNAMEFVLGGVAELGREALLAETATLLGYPRLPGPARVWVVEALERGLGSRRFAERDGLVRLP